MRRVASTTVLFFLLWSSACEPVTHDMRGEAPDGGARCVDGQRLCQGVQTLAECVGGEGWVLSECEHVCAEGLGCVACLPGTRSCEGRSTVLECAVDGSELAPVDSCEEDERCVGGQCTVGCEGGTARPSSLGCEFWPVDLDNAETSFGGLVLDNAAGRQLAVGVLNPETDHDASVTLEIDQAGPGEAPLLVTLENALLPPGGSHFFSLPRRDVDGESITAGHDDGEQSGLSRRSFRLTSSRPVAAFQWNPIDDALCTEASLLMPAERLDGRYRVVGWFPSTPIDVFGLPINRSYVTIVGTAEETSVSVTPTYAVLAGGGVARIAAGETFDVTLDAFDVLNLETEAAPSFFAPRPDLSGTLVEASSPVVVYSGVDQATVPLVPVTVPGDEEASSCCPDHMEEQLLPEAALGAAYVVARSPIRSSGDYVEPDYVRVVSLQADTTVTTTAEGTFTLGAGEVRQLEATGPFVLEATGPVAVGQFLTGGEQTNMPSLAGDPAFLQIPPVDQGLSTVPFLVGGELAGQWVVIVGPAEAEPTLDGTPVSWCSVEAAGELAGTPYLAHTCPVAPGVHVAAATSEARLLVTVYGYSDDAAWAYVAGTGLDQLR